MSWSCTHTITPCIKYYDVIKDTEGLDSITHSACLINLFPLKKHFHFTKKASRYKSFPIKIKTVSVHKGFSSTQHTHQNVPWKTYASVKMNW